MTKIPKKILDDILSDPYYKICARAGYHGHICDGKITFEHALIYAGRQIQEKFAIIPLCEKAHSVNKYQDGGDINKDINVWIALSRATPDQLHNYSKAINYSAKLTMLNTQYGTYTENYGRTSQPMVRKSDSREKGASVSSAV